ncbi:MAG: hypothetical protein HY289_00845 [Planctomycetes bacterium]|nr:hypothetical protein [Planctomycetota bacterium]
MPYIPGPIDSDYVFLANRVLNVTEVLAKNTHDIWARSACDPKPTAPVDFRSTCAATDAQRALRGL